jgi:polyisoprenoid-binding protein YceI
MDQKGPAMPTSGTRLAVVVAGAAAALVLALPVSGRAQSAPTFDFTITGTSTIRGWTCSAKGTVAITQGGGPAAPGFPTGVKSVVLTVPHKAFTCPNAEMTEHLNQAMQSDKFSEVVFTLEKYEAAGTQWNGSGQMKILGTTKPVTVPLTLTPGPGGVEVSGTFRLLLADYGVEPPTVMLGMLKVGPQIRLEFKGVVPAAR